MRAVRNPRGSHGLALAILVIILAALAMAYFFGAMGTANRSVEASNASAASFTKIDEALVRFAMMYKRLPCPANGLANTGAEDPQPNAFNLATGTQTCNSPSGVVPWKALGLSQAEALDPWSRYISYRVFDGASGFTRTGGVDVTNCINESVLTGYSTGTCASTHENTIADYVSGKGISVNDFGTAKTGIAYVLISMGESGLGSYYPNGSAPMTMPSGSSKEFLNAGSAGTYWLLAASSREIAATDASHFDDVLSYTTAYDVAAASRLSRPWPLKVTLDGSSTCAPPTAACANVSPTLTMYLSGLTPINPIKMATSGQGAVTVGVAADSTRYICTESGGGNTAMAACAVPGDEITTSGNERLTFDFKVRRAAAMLRLLGMQHTGGSDEQAQITFFNGATQVAQFTKVACHTGGNAIGQYAMAMPSGVEFTSIEVRALNKTSGGTSSISVAAVAACYPSSATCQVPSYNSADDCP